MKIHAVTLRGLALLAVLAATGCSTPMQADAPPIVERSSNATTWLTPEAAALAAAEAAKRSAPRAPAGTAGTRPPTPATPPAAAPAAAAPALAARTAPAEAEAPIQRIVYFDFDRFDIKDEFKPMLERRARQLAADGGRRIVIEGHADERGGREYNLALGQKRAESVLRALALLGVPESRMEAVSFGDTRPAVEGSSELAWSQNRRTELKDR